MMLNFFPVRKFKRNGIYVVFAGVLTLAVLAAYLEFRATNEWSASDVSMNRETLTLFKAAARSAIMEDLNEGKDTWTLKNIQQPWRIEYKGQANLHVFEDWCGTSVAQLHKNLHYPLYPHSRTTVKKLAVSPSWTNYGLRIFGYIHPYADGDFVFAVASDDNSEFWLSDDEDPDHLKLRAYVGKTGREWTAPGEYGKYGSQISDLIPLQKERKYFFELIHKQDDHGTDHVELAWQLKQTGSGFTIIDANYISLYINESSLKAGDVSHIPQTAASHVTSPQRLTPPHRVDMMRDDPRDSFHQLPLLDRTRVHGMLPDCIYNPSYIIKGYPLMRYQGLQFVYLTYVYPNDYTRLTHMESENKCLYRANPYYLDRYGFSNYMQLDPLENEDISLKFKGDMRQDRLAADRTWNKGNNFLKPDKYNERRNDLPDYGDDYDDYTMQRRRKLFSVQKHGVIQKKREDWVQNIGIHQENQPKAIQQPLDNHPEGQKRIIRRQPKKAHPQPNPEEQIFLQNAPREVETFEKGFAVGNRPGRYVQDHRRSEVRNHGRRVDFQPLELQHTNTSDGKHNPITVRDMKVIQRGFATSPVIFNEVRNGHQDIISRNSDQKVIFDTSHKKRDEMKPKKVIVNETDEHPSLNMNKGKAVVMKKTQKYKRKTETLTLKNETFYTQKNAPNLQEVTKKRSKLAEYNQTNLHKSSIITVPSQEEYKIHYEHFNRGRHENQINLQDNAIHVYDNSAAMQENRIRFQDDQVNLQNNAMYEQGKQIQETDVDQEEDETWVNPGLSEEDFELNHRAVFDEEVKWTQTFQAKPLDLYSMRSDWIDLKCNVSGNLLLGEPEALAVVEAFMRKLNKRFSRQFSLDRIVNIEKKPDYNRGSRYLLELDLLEASGRHMRLVQYVFVKRSDDWVSKRKESFREINLCNPYKFYWNPGATVHFIIPVKNQARWVKQFISDMERLYRATGDQNFNVIITDYESTDMNVEQELRNSYLPRYQYLKLNGNFERSAGLQAGIDLIADEHSIVFLCDLHIHFPSGFIDIVRKHCVEKHMAFAPIVMRLNCGATPLEPDGYWEVNGFGLLGIYKSDLDAIGGMNTREFTDRWGGEDWELLDRVLQGGLEVERLYLRNFFHYFHSKRGMWNRKMLRTT